MPSPDPYIQLWFTELRKFQAACINNAAGKLSLLNFANAAIISYLISASSQSNFITASGYPDIQPADLTTYKTFGGLLNYCHSLSNEIFNALQALSVPGLQNVDSIPYYAATVATAFPDGSTGPAWTAAQTMLMGSMDPTCFTLAFRLQVNATVNKAGATMKDLITQISGLG